METVHVVSSVDFRIQTLGERRQFAVMGTIVSFGPSVSSHMSICVGIKKTVLDKTVPSCM